MPDPIVFKDMAEREAAERRRLADRQFELEQLRHSSGALPRDLQAELAAIKRKLGNKSKVIDPLFEAVQAELDKTNEHVADHQEGKLPSQVTPTRPAAAATTPATGSTTATGSATTTGSATGPATAPATAPRGAGAFTPGKLTNAEQALAAVYGILERDNQTNPAIGRRFVTSVALARGEFNGNRALFIKVLPILVGEGDGTGRDNVRAEQWSGVVRTLVGQGVTDDDDHLALKTRLALASVEGADDGANPSSLAIDLPRLEETEELEIVVDNLHAMQALYFAAMLEEVKLFQVVEKLVELFQQGMLPLGRGKAGDFLYGYWKKAVDRLSEVERRNLYARAFGFPGGEPQGAPNREFNELWLRFVSAVSSFRRQLTVDELLRSSIPVTVSEEQVRKSGRDLAANASLHGYGIAYFAATELQTQIREVIGLLSDPELKAAFGARDMWGVVDQVATLELGGARNSVRYRTMATSGAVIMRWLAERASVLATASRASVLNLQNIRDTTPRPAGHNPTNDPTDRDLVEACEQWLAVTGTPDLRVEEYSQPSEGPTTISSPIRIPSIASDLLASVGVSGNGLPKS
jgi:hypothetical protein